MSLSSDPSAMAAIVELLAANIQQQQQDVQEEGADAVPGYRTTPGGGQVFRMPDALLQQLRQQATQAQQQERGGGEGEEEEDATFMTMRISGGAGDGPVDVSRVRVVGPGSMQPASAANLPPSFVQSMVEQGVDISNLVVDEDPMGFGAELAELASIITLDGSGWNNEMTQALNEMCSMLGLGTIQMADDNDIHLALASVLKRDDAPSEVKATAAQGLGTLIGLSLECDRTVWAPVPGMPARGRPTNRTSMVEKVHRTLPYAALNEMLDSDHLPSLRYGALLACNLSIGGTNPEAEDTTMNALGADGLIEHGVLTRLIGVMQLAGLNEDLKRARWHARGAVRNCVVYLMELLRTTTEEDDIRTDDDEEDDEGESDDDDDDESDDAWVTDDDDDESGEQGLSVD
ncbi:hypothetical protein RI054_14g70180 [Pseudoscourfieldia marina]